MKEYKKKRTKFHYDRSRKHSISLDINVHLLNDARKLPTTKAKTHIVHRFTVTQGISVHETVKVSNNFQRASSSLEFRARDAPNLHATLFTVNNFPPF